MSETRTIYPFADHGKIEHTRIHNDILDYVMPLCRPNEWKVVCAVLRKTIGWADDSSPTGRKQADVISMSQFHALTGIKSRETLVEAVHQAISDGYIVRESDGADSFSYRLNRLFGLDITGTEIVPVDERSRNRTGSGLESRPEAVRFLDTQKEGKVKENNDTDPSDSEPEPPAPSSPLPTPPISAESGPTEKKPRRKKVIEPEKRPDPDPVPDPYVTAVCRLMGRNVKALGPRSVNQVQDTVKVWRAKGVTAPMVWCGREDHCKWKKRRCAVHWWRDESSDWRAKLSQPAASSAELEVVLSYLLDPAPGPQYFRPKQTPKATPRSTSGSGPRAELGLLDQRGGTPFRKD